MEPITIALGIVWQITKDNPILSGILGNRSDHFFVSGLKQIKKIISFRDPEYPKNHDLLRTLRKSMLTATDMLRLAMKKEGEQGEFRKSLDEWIKKQIKLLPEIDKWHNWSSPANDNLELFFANEKIHSSKKDELLLAMTSSWEEYISQQLKTELPQEFKDKLNHGWYEKGKLITWKEATIVLMIEALRDGDDEMNKRAAKAFEHNFLSEIKLELGNLSIQMSGIESMMSDIYTRMLELFPNTETIVGLSKTIESQQSTIESQQSTIRKLVEDKLLEFQKLQSKLDELDNTREGYKESFDKIFNEITSLKQYLFSVNLDLSKDVYITNPQYLAEDLKKESKNKFKEIVLENKFIGNLIESILPATTSLEKNIVKNYTPSKPILVSDIETLWDKKYPKSNMILSGEGGSGKTFSLYNLWNYYLENDANVIPIFIQLRSINRNSNSNIVDEVCRQAFKHNFIGASNEIKRNIINNIFCNSNSNYKFILILDGLNELSDPKFIETFLNQSIEDWRCVQIIISSRHPFNTEVLNDFTYIHLNQLTVETVKNYLNSNGINEVSNKIIRLLSNPMRLTMYSNSNHQIENINELLESKTQIELLRKINSISFLGGTPTGESKLFRKRDSFYTKGDLTYDYVLSLCIREIIIKNQENSLEDFASFSTQYLLPLIGFHLEQNNLYSIDENEILKLISNSKLTLTEIKKRNISDTKSYIQDVLKLCVSRLTLLELDSDKLPSLVYQFLHQEFRDYFSSIWILNSLKNWNSSAECSYESIPVEIKNKIISPNVLEYLGQVDGEHRNIPVLKEDEFWHTTHFTKTEIKSSLNKLRKKFNKKKLGYTTENLVNAMISVKSDFSGDDLSELYLIGIDFSNLIFSRRNETLEVDRIHSSFHKSKLELKDFFPKGHKPLRRQYEVFSDFYDNKIISMKVSSEKQIVTTGTKSDLIDWDIKTGKLIEKRSIPYIYDCDLQRVQGGNILNPEISCCPIDLFISSNNEGITITTENKRAYYVERDENLLHHGYHNRFGSHSGWLGIWDLVSGKVNRFYDIFRGGWYCYDLDSGMLAVTSVDGFSIEVWDDRQRKSQWEIQKNTFHNQRSLSEHLADTALVSRIEHENLIRACCFIHDTDKLVLVTASEDGKIIEWDCKTGNQLRTYKNVNSKEEFILGGSPDGVFLVTCNSHRGERLEYEKEQMGEELLTEAFDIIEYKKEEYGNLRFWRRENSELSKELKVEGKSLIRKIVFLDKNYSETKSDFKYFITGNQDGGLTLYDYETFEVSKIYSKPTKKLYPTSLKYRDIGKLFIATYRDGYIKMFSSETHLCIASAKGDLKHPDAIKFYGFRVALIIDYWNSSCEIWNLSNFTRKNNRKLILSNRDLPYVNLNPKLTKVYSCVSENLHPFNSNYQIQVYDMEGFGLINSFEIKEMSIKKENFFISPNDKYILFLSHSTNHILIYDLVNNKYSGSVETKEIKTIKLLNGEELVQTGKTDMQFFVIFNDYTCSFIYFHEDTRQFSVRGDENLSKVKFPSHSNLQQYLKDNKLMFGLIYSSFNPDRPKEHIVYNWQFGTPTVVQLEKYIEPVVKEPMFGNPYPMERAFDYSFIGDSSLHLLQNPYMEYFTVESNRISKRIFESYHDDSVNLAIHGCKFPAFDTRFSLEEQEQAQILEKNDANFDVAYQLFNYPNTYAFKHLKFKGTRFNFIESFRFFLARGLVKLFSIPIYFKHLFFDKRNIKAISQNFLSPYNFKPKTLGKGKSGIYYESVPFKY